MDEIEGLFPVPLMRSPGLLPARLVAALADQVRAERRNRNDRSELLSHTEIVNPSSSPLFAEVVELLQPKLAEFGVLLFGDRMPWFVKEMWTNVLGPGGSQAMHAHANSFVSGILYLTPSHPSAHTVFVRNPGGSEFTFRHNSRTTQLGPFNAGKYVTPEIAPGDLLLFPSYLLHEVPRNGGEERLTMAFNAIPERLDSWGYSIGFRP
ncbi:MAG: putative 2OG-Fe(II) oxygenase [Janthinobacterium lividum]